MIRDKDLNKDITLLELACGKAQDLHKWENNNIRNIVGIDVIKDNIENPYNGAYARLISSKNKKNVMIMTFNFWWAM